MKKIAVAILNWNGQSLLERFLPGVLEHSSEADVIVIDNGSTDSSLAWLSSSYPDLRVISFAENYGFTGGYNKAMNEIDHEFTVLLNSDVEVTQGWLSPILNRFGTDPKISAVQPKVRSLNEPDKFEYAGACGGFIDHLGYPFCRGRMFSELEVDRGQYDEAMPVFWSTGACLAVRTEVYKALGGLDPQFFAHMEEIDLCWRMQRNGYSCWVEPASTVYHLGGGTLSSQSKQKTYLNFRNNLILLTRNLPTHKILPTVLIRLILDGLAGVQFLISGKAGHTIAIIKGHFHFYGRLGKIMKAREGEFPWPLEGVYRKSIVRQFYLGKIRSFSRLEHSAFAKTRLDR